MVAPLPSGKVQALLLKVIFIHFEVLINAIITLN